MTPRLTVNPSDWVSFSPISCGRYRPVFGALYPKRSTSYVVCISIIFPCVAQFPAPRVLEMPPHECFSLYNFSRSLQGLAARGSLSLSTLSTAQPHELSMRCVPPGLLECFSCWLGRGIAASMGNAMACFLLYVSALRRYNPFRFPMLQISASWQLGRNSVDA